MARIERGVLIGVYVKKKYVISSIFYCKDTPYLLFVYGTESSVHLLSDVIEWYIHDHSDINNLLKITDNQNDVLMECFIATGVIAGAVNFYTSLKKVYANTDVDNIRVKRNYNDDICVICWIESNIWSVSTIPGDDKVAYLTDSKAIELYRISDEENK